VSTIAPMLLVPAAVAAGALNSKSSMSTPDAMALTIRAEPLAGRTSAFRAVE
jgi:hypothetical protein